MAGLLACLVAFFALGLGSDLTLDSMAAHERALRGAVLDSRLLVAAVFVVTFAAAAAVSIPCASLFTVAGGLLFGTWEGAAYSVIATTAGSAVVYVATRLAAQDPLAHAASPAVARLRTELARAPFGYLMGLRLIPIVPFWFVNVVPAALGIPFRTYVAATVLAIVPISVVYAAAGETLGVALRAGGVPTWEALVRPELMISLSIAAAVLLVAVAISARRGRRALDT